MKLRLENGNFTIKETYDVETNTDKYGPLPTGLKPIDFIGSVVSFSSPGFDWFTTVIKANTNEDYPRYVVELAYFDDTLTTLYYNSLNGKVSKVIENVLDDDSSGSDDDGDGGDVIK